jgi:hypothetical protein
LTGREIKPLYIIGTQRSSYTHRKNRKKLKEISNNLKNKIENN